MLNMSSACHHPHPASSANTQGWEERWWI